jgi:hypothetical protein
MVDLIPQEFSRFDCSEYFRNFQAGRYDTNAQLWFILPVIQIRSLSEEDALIVGRPGVDGIEFCYRFGHPGVWAFYPIERQWRAVSSTLRDLEDRWNDGSLSV